MARISGIRTLGEVRKSYSSKAAFNKAMRMDARDRLFETSAQNKCKYCGETRQVDICHIKAISEFDDNALIEEINGAKNNMVLCPLHHRLFDNKMLDISDINDGTAKDSIKLILGFQSEEERKIKISEIKKYILEQLERNELLKNVKIICD